MINKIFEKYFPKTTQYFDELLNSEKDFPQSIVLEGSDIWGQYFFARELARILNCKNRDDENCDCLNCRWIRENKHDCLMTYSPIDSKANDDKSKTVISVKQIDEIVKNVAYSSDFHRVFIFLGAHKGESEKYIQEQYLKYESLGFEVEEDWVPDFLNRKIFTKEAVNRFLKAIEEPPSRTTFIFLTKNKEDLLQTVVSRSFVFKMPASKYKFEYDEILALVKKYPDIKIEDIPEMVKNIENYIKEKNILNIEFLNKFEQYLGDLYLQNPKMKIKKDIKNIWLAKRYLLASIRPSLVYENLLISLL